MPDPPAEGLGRKAARGAAWAGVSRLGQQVLQMISVAALARLLEPSDYGLVAMAGFFTNLLQQMGDLGTGAAVIQRENLTPRLTASLFWFNVLLGAAGAMALWIAAPAAALYYHEPKVTGVLSALALMFAAAGFGIVPQALLVRRMEYRKLCVGEIGSAALSAAVAIAAAWRGAGAWSLVLGSLTLATANSALMWALSGWRPRWSLAWDEVRSVMGYSMNLTGFVVVNYLSRNAGHLIVGRYLGRVALGYYQMAYSLLLYPLQALGSVLGRVIFATFSRMQEDRERLRAAVLRYLTVIGAAALPVFLGLWVAADSLVPVLLGAKWVPVIPLLAIVAPFGVLQAVSGQTGQIYISVGRTDVMLKVGVAAAAVQVAGYAAGLPWGLTGVLLSWAIANLLVGVAGLVISHRLIRAPVAPLIRALGPAVVYSLAMTAAAWSWKLLAARWGLPPGVVLAGTVLCGAVVYLGLIALRRPWFALEAARQAAKSESRWLRRIGEGMLGQPRGS